MPFRVLGYLKKNWFLSLKEGLEEFLGFWFWDWFGLVWLLQTEFRELFIKCSEFAFSSRQKKSPHSIISGSQTFRPLSNADAPQRSPCLQPSLCQGLATQGLARGVCWRGQGTGPGWWQAQLRRRLPGRQQRRNPQPNNSPSPPVLVRAGQHCTWKDVRH